MPATEEQIIIHKAAKKAFDALGGKIPKIKDLNAEYNMVRAQKQKDYADYREAASPTNDLLFPVAMYR